MRQLLSTLIVLIVLLVPVLGLSFEIEIVNDTKGKLAYQIREVKAVSEESGVYDIFIVASGELDSQTRITEPQNFPVGQYLINISLTNKGKPQVLKNDILIDSSIIKVLINSYELLITKGINT